jgi:hypothetical protein
MGRTGNEEIESEAQCELEGDPVANGLARVNRRHWSMATAGEEDDK